MKKVLGVLTALLIAWSPVSANEVGTCGYLYDDWVEYKKPDDDSTQKLYRSTHYIGYISGFVGGDTIIKFPNNGTIVAYLHIVGKWLESHPEMWHKHQASCVFLALREAYGMKD